MRYLLVLLLITGCVWPGSSAVVTHPYAADLLPCTPPPSFTGKTDDDLVKYTIKVVQLLWSCSDKQTELAKQFK